MTQINGDWLVDRRTQKVLAMLGDGGHQVFLVGGCVRNALLGVAVADIDIATDARPEQVMDLAAQAGLKSVPTGIDHGTITVVTENQGFEVTTFRKDVETDGRRATVAFADTIADDARRRDFTMNALYADAAGHVVDPLGGLRDVVARRVRFIDDANDRIQEDNLRSLRFFRFHAWYGDPKAGMDRDALSAIASNLPGLARLSHERIVSELLKLLSAPDPAPAVAAMQHAGVLAAVLPGADGKALALLVHIENGIAADPIRRLAAICGVSGAGEFRLSRAQRRQLDLLRRAVGKGDTVAANGYRHGAQVAVDIALLNAAMFEQEPASGHRDIAAFGAAQSFPVSSADLIDHVQGPALGRKLKELEDRWIRSNFELTKSQLLA